MSLAGVAVAGGDDVLTALDVFTVLCALRNVLRPPVNGYLRAGGGMVPGGCAVTPHPRPYLCPGITSGSQKTGCANRIFSVQRPFPVCESMSRTTWVQGFPHDATKIKVDAEHPARLPDPPRAVVVKLGKCPEKPRSNAPFPVATAG